MGKLEKEVKVLNIDIRETKKRLKKIGATFKAKKDQKIYTYDIPTIYYRYLEIMNLLKSDNELLIQTSISKLGIVLDEFEDLVQDEELKEIFDELQISNFNELLKMNSTDIVSKLEKSVKFNALISEKFINPNKWLRLRQSNDKVELTIKHIYEKDNSKIQKVKEFEVNVSSIEEMNKLLNEMGIIRRNYQEKIRHSFVYKNAEIEIDEWPRLEPYMEIECEDEKIINEIISKLDYSEKEIVSVNTEQLYKKQNIDILRISDLKF